MMPGPTTGQGPWVELVVNGTGAGLESNQTATYTV
jgi:hypothetical protein